MNMKFSVVILILFFSCHYISLGQDSDNQENNLQYYDKDNNRISVTEFDELEKKGGFYTITSDSLKISKLTPKKEKGTLENKNQWIIHLEKLTGRKIDSNRPIILIFHPGKDPCNSSGTATPETTKEWYGQLEKGTNRIAKTEPIYISKVPEDLKERDKVVNWHEDKGQVIETRFFKFHYPCGSFVIIAENGDYFSSFGEYDKQYLWKMLKEMN